MMLEELEIIDRLIDQSKYDEAHHLTDQVIQSERICAELYYLKSRIFNRQREKEKAIEWIDKALKLESNNEKYWFAQARCFIYIKQYSEAIYSFSKVINLEIGSGDKYYTKSAYFFRAIANFELANYTQTLKDLANVDDDYQVWIGKFYSKIGLIKEISKS